jgi:peptidoglycan hydrolase-like protein with peptidoglycan-binding domain
VPPYPGYFSVGSKGPYVKAVQKGLVASGYKLVVDGAFGQQTGAAVRAYRNKHASLRPASAVVDAKTYKMLALAV